MTPFHTETPAGIAARQAAPDFVRGVAIVLMVYGHLTHIGSMAAVQNELVSWIYTFHMPAFLFISGYFFKVDGDFKDRIVRLGRRLVIPYLLFVTIYLLGLLAARDLGLHSNNPPPSSTIEIFQILFLHAQHPRGAYWFIYTLIVVQFCFICAWFANVRFYLPAGSWIVIAVVLLALACHAGLLWFSAVPYFLLGMTFALNRAPIPASFGVGLFGIISILLVAPSEIFSFSFIKIAWCLAAVATLAALSSVVGGHAARFFAWLGRNTLIILLCHSLFVLLMKPLGKLFLLVDPTGILYAVVVTVVTVIGCLAVAAFFDRAGLSEWIFGTMQIYSPHNKTSSVAKLTRSGGNEMIDVQEEGKNAGWQPSRDSTSRAG
ncbi:Acyltransferase family protein [Rhodovastum atsumiense]|nr:acyltransferase family protein [Rhodovastum atsumiense]CAH2603057.1 Acyltransferase family protein [Rhodovastum atsumiense]